VDWSFPYRTLVDWRDGPYDLMKLEQILGSCHPSVQLKVVILQRPLLYRVNSKFAGRESTKPEKYHTWGARHISGPAFIREQQSFQDTIIRALRSMPAVPRFVLPFYDAAADCVCYFEQLAIFLGVSHSTTQQKIKQLCEGFHGSTRTIQHMPSMMQEQVILVSESGLQYGDVSSYFNGPDSVHVYTKAVSLQEKDAFAAGLVLLGVNIPSGIGLDPCLYVWLPGIACTVTNQTYTSIARIDLHDNKLQGILPIFWSVAFTDITEIDLHNNFIAGTLPGEWGNGFPDLRILYLQHNLFDGTLPESWSSLNSLQELDLSSNLFSGCLPTSWFMPDGLQTVRWLSVAQNQLTGHIPAEWNLGGARDLGLLFLNHNLLSGVLPAAWSSATFPSLQLVGLKMSGVKPCNIPLQWKSSFESKDPLHKMTLRLIC